MRTFKTREQDSIKVDTQYQIEITSTRKRTVKVGEMNLNEETLHFDIASLLDDLETGDSYMLEFVFNEVRFWISYNQFGELEQTAIVLVPFKNGKINEVKVQKEYIDTRLKTKDSGVFAADLYFLVKG